MKVRARFKIVFHDNKTSASNDLEPGGLLYFALLTLMAKPFVGRREDEEPYWQCMDGESMLDLSPQMEHIARSPNGDCRIKRVRAPLDFFLRHRFYLAHHLSQLGFACPLHLDFCNNGGHLGNRLRLKDAA